jgi:signal transduction histidine kinase/ActR/RegA family two-component response regulator
MGYRRYRGPECTIPPILDSVKNKILTIEAHARIRSVTMLRGYGARTVRGVEQAMNEPQLARILTDRRDDIVARFVTEVRRKDLPPAELDHSLLVDHIPKFLDEIIAELERVQALRGSQDAVDGSMTARQHGEQRWSLGYDLGALIREYGVLRHCIFEIAKSEDAQPGIDEIDVLAKCLSVGVAEAATAYIEHRDSEATSHRGRLEFLVQAGKILSSSLDHRSTLGALTRLLVPGVADWCAVHLEGTDVEDMHIVHVDPAKAAAVRDLCRRSPSLLEATEPAFLESTAQRLIVPLRVQGNVFGAITLAYADSGRHYHATDLVLAEELANKAAVALDNARLYELSQQERSRVEAATRAKDEFVAMVSHELRTPLNAILGWVRLIRGNAIPLAKRDHAFEVIERNALAQDRLVADLLDISRVITGKVRINPSQVDLVNVVEMAIEGIRPAADAKRIETTVDLGEGSAIMRGDGERLQQIVFNLLTNAIKFTPKNGKVAVRLRRIESDFEVLVEDNGEGITEEFLPHVFESFRQSDTSSARPHGGLGIGLTIARHLVELHGGSITALSAGSGHGATFRVRLPISPLVSSTFGVTRVPATDTEAPDNPVGESLDGIRVLVVDDDGDARDLVSFVLESCGAEVHQAWNMAQALAALQTYTPHVIVSDIGMPDGDGYALVRSIRTLAAEDKKNIPVIALTAFARGEDRTRALVEGFNVHMTKPVEPTALARAVADLAGKPTSRR